jgi:predicted DsbA family dithiol-disulfide isomerase
MVKLDILSDPICPWCYIGWLRLRSVLERMTHPFVIEWHPFQLNTGMPKNGMQRQFYLETKFGGQKGVLEAYMPIAKAAEEAGHPIAFDKIERTPNTLDAHRLIHWAGQEGKQTQMAEALFEAYFQQGRDIGTVEVLTKIAGECGMDEGAIFALLQSDADKIEIRERDLHSREKGVREIPTFIVAQTHVVPGAQPPELWENVIKELTPPEGPLQ